MSARNREKRRHPTTARRPASRTPATVWLVPAAIAAVVAGFVWLGRADRPASTVRTGTVAPAFTLTSTAGDQVSLSDYRGDNVLLYFNEGLGCDACFYQMNELEKHASHLGRANIAVLPIVVNPVSDVQAELRRFGIRTPYLVDTDRRVSFAYDMIGHGMHADLPGHGFVLVDPEGRVTWRGEFPSMYVGAMDLLHRMGFSG